MDPQMRIGLVDPITRQPVPYEPQNIDPEMVKQVMATLKSPPDATPPAPKVIAGPDAARQLPAAKPFDVGSNPNPAFINAMLNNQAAGASVAAPPQRTSAELQAALTNDLARGGGQSGQYLYSPRTIAEKRGALEDVNSAMRAQAAQTTAEAAKTAATSKSQELTGPINIDLERKREAIKNDNTLTLTEQEDKLRELEASTKNLVTKVGGTTTSGGEKPPPPSPANPIQRQLDDAAIVMTGTKEGPKPQLREPGEFIHSLASRYGEGWVEQNLPYIQNYMMQKRAGGSTRGVPLWGPDYLNKWMQQTVYTVPEFMKGEDRKGYDLYTSLQMKQGRSIPYQKKALGIPVKETQYPQNPYLFR